MVDFIWYPIELLAIVIFLASWSALRYIVLNSEHFLSYSSQAVSCGGTKNIKPTVCYMDPFIGLWTLKYDAWKLLLPLQVAHNEAFGE